MMIQLVAGFAGSVSQPSKTRALVELAARGAADRFGAAHHVFDLCDLGRAFGAARRLEEVEPEARNHIDLLLSADALVVGSPVYKGSYTGLFKHAFDLLPADALRARPVLLCATGGGDRHALVIEHQMRPLFGFFEAATLPTGVYASDREFEGGAPMAPALLERLERALQQFGGAAAEPGSRPFAVAASAPLFANGRASAAQVARGPAA